MRMTNSEIKEYVQAHPSGKVKIAFTDIDGILRGKYISSGKFLSVIESGTSFCDVIFGWDAADITYDNVTFTGWHSGYPDCPARLDLSTFRKIPWEDDVPFFLGEMVDTDAEPAQVCPRQLLKTVLNTAKDE